ncbi:MAG: VWA domain-containing protein [Planctomycetota bacterium]
MNGEFVLEQPWWLALLPLVALCAVRGALVRATLRFAPAALVGGSRVRPPLRARLVALPVVLRAAAVAAAILALAGPGVRATVAPETLGVDVLLCLDTSSSMTATDVGGSDSRLDVAKRSAAAFVAARPDDRVGLVTFARYSDVACPATRDHAALLSSLGRVAAVEQEGDEDLTGIGAAVARAADRLRSAPSASRVVVLLTDGVESVADAAAPDEIDLEEASRVARALDVRVHAIALGGGDDEDLRRGREELQRLATSTGGTFARAGDARTLDAVYAEIDRLEREPVAEPRRVVEDRVAPFLGAALGLAVLAELLAATLFRSVP